MILPTIFLIIKKAFGNIHLDQVGFSGVRQELDCPEGQVTEFNALEPFCRDAIGLDEIILSNSDLGSNLAIIVFIVGILAVAVIVGRRFSKKKKR